MGTSVILLFLIYSISVIFWFRFLYLRSLRKAEDRQHLVHSTGRLIILLPLGLQAAFLFCYAFYQVVPLGIDFSDLFEETIFGNRKTAVPDLHALKIITAGSVLIGINYTM